MREQLEKGGVLGAGQTRKKKKGVLGAGQVQKGGSLRRHIPILNIYVSTHPRGGDLMCIYLRGLTLAGSSWLVVFLKYMLMSGDDFRKRACILSISFSFVLDIPSHCTAYVRMD